MTENVMLPSLLTSATCIDPSTNTTNAFATATAVTTTSTFTNTNNINKSYNDSNNINNHFSNKSICNKKNNNNNTISYNMPTASSVVTTAANDANTFTKTSTKRHTSNNQIHNNKTATTTTGSVSKESTLFITENTSAITTAPIITPTTTSTNVNINNNVITGTLESAAAINAGVGKLCGAVATSVIVKPSKNTNKHHYHNQQCKESLTNKKTTVTVLTMKQNSGPLEQPHQQEHSSQLINVNSNNATIATAEGTTSTSRHFLSKSSSANVVSDIMNFDTSAKINSNIFAPAVTTTETDTGTTTSQQQVVLLSC